MDLIGSHLEDCPHCRGEYQSLLDTKRLLASLAHRTSRAEIESLLRSEEEKRFLEPAAGGFFRGALRPKPLAATALLSLAGLWVASASLDTPADGVAPGGSSLSSPVTAAAMPSFGIGRGLRYLNEMVHSGPVATPVIIPVNANGLVMSPETPYPVPISGNDLPYRNSVSLGNVLSTATTSSRDQAAPVTISVYAVSGAGATAVLYTGATNYSRRYSASAQRLR